MNGSSFSDIKNTIDDFSDCDAILLNNRTYFGSGSQIIIDKDSLLVCNVSDFERATLDGYGLSYIVLFNVILMLLFVFVNFINGNSGSNFDCFIAARSTVVVENCTIRDNEGESGGAIFIRSSANNCMFLYSTFINNEGVFDNNEFIEGGSLDTNGYNTTIIGSYFELILLLLLLSTVNFRINSVEHKLINCIFNSNLLLSVELELLPIL